MCTMCTMCTSVLQCSTNVCVHKIIIGSTCTFEGFISMDEFEEACCLLGKHTASVIPREHVLAMARNMDLNKDGHEQTTRRTTMSTSLDFILSLTSTFLQTTRRATK